MALHYVEAGNILDQLTHFSLKPLTLKALFYKKKELKPLTSTIFALVSETLKYKQILDELIEKSFLVENNKNLKGRGHIIHVMLYDLFFGKLKSISGSGTVKKTILSYSTRLKAELTKIKVHHRVSDLSSLVPEYLKQVAVLPRWVRVNLLCTDVKTVISHFEKQGWRLDTVEQFFTKLDRYQEEVASGLKDKSKFTKEFCIDRDLPSILAFPPMTDLHDHPLLINGHIILQDKASALAGSVLQPPASPNTVVLDACAAPGQKTSQLAQSMQNMGTLYALDRDSSRIAILKTLCKRHNLKNVTIIHLNFLDIDVLRHPYNQVEYILLDPSCSCTGIVNRLDFAIDSLSTELTPYTETEKISYADIFNTPRNRLENLQQFQLSLLQKAFSFPKVNHILYSTCSIHDEENEQVIEKSLKFTTEFEVCTVLPNLRSSMRGKSQYSYGERCVRTVPKRDHTIGFFIAYLKRKSITSNPENENQLELSTATRKIEKTQPDFSSGLNVSSSTDKIEYWPAQKKLKREENDTTSGYLRISSNPSDQVVKEPINNLMSISKSKSNLQSKRNNQRRKKKKLRKPIIR